MSRLRVNVTLLIAGLIATAGSLVYHHWASRYPYGASHCCILAMASSLQSYASANKGRFPSGGATPEASLGMLNGVSGIGPEILRGMTVQESKTRRALEQGHPLSPATCGWHYVEGLTLADDPRIAILWCKEALDHNGRRWPDGRREVVYVDGRRRQVSGDEWPAFLADQEKLIANRSERAKQGLPLVSAVVELPDGTRAEQFDGSYRLTETSRSPSGSGSGHSSGTSFNASELIWFHPPIQTGTVTRTLHFNNMQSEPVTVTFIDGKPDTDAVVFKLQSTQ